MYLFVSSSKFKINIWSSCRAPGRKQPTVASWVLKKVLKQKNALSLKFRLYFINLYKKTVKSLTWVFIANIWSYILNRSMTSAYWRQTDIIERPSITSITDMIPLLGFLRSLVEKIYPIICFTKLSCNKNAPEPNRILLCPCYFHNDRVFNNKNSNNMSKLANRQKGASKIQFLTTVRT